MSIQSPQIIFLVSRLLPLDRLHTAHKLPKNKVSGLKSLSISIVPDCNLCCQISHAATLPIGSSSVLVVAPRRALILSRRPALYHPCGNSTTASPTTSNSWNFQRSASCISLPFALNSQPEPSNVLVRRRGGRHRRWSGILVGKPSSGLIYRSLRDLSIRNIHQRLLHFPSHLF